MPSLPTAGSPGDKAQPKASIQPQQQGTGSSSNVPSPSLGCAWGHSISQPSLPFPSFPAGWERLQWEWRGLLISWRDPGVRQMSPDPAEGQGLHSHHCPASSGTEGTEQHWCSRPLPHSSSLSEKLFLGLAPLFPGSPGRYKALVVTQGRAVTASLHHQPRQLGRESNCAFPCGAGGSWR